MKDEFKPSVNEKQKITDKKLNIDSPSQEKSPEEIIKSFANINDGTESTTPEKKDFAVPEKYSKKRFLNLSNPFSKLSKLSKKQKIIFIFGIVVLFIVLAGGAYALFKPKSPQNIVSTTTHKTIKKEEPKPTTEASKLSGVQVPIGTNTKTVVSIQIEATLLYKARSPMPMAPLGISGCQTGLAFTGQVVSKTVSTPCRSSPTVPPCGTGIWADQFHMDAWY